MLRLLSHLLDSGPTQMCRDEALLETAQPGQATMRTYTWSTATLSLGYFQDYPSVRAQLPSSTLPMPMVRRITGGGAIWHQHEVTYCLVAWYSDLGLARLEDLYLRMHAAVAAALARHGAGARVALNPTSMGDRRYAAEPRCFASPAVGDLMSATGAGTLTAKVLGSAARRRGERLLVHGSLKLASNPWDGSAVAGCGCDAATAQQVLIEALASTVGKEPQPGAWTDAEDAASARLLRERYASPAWVEERKGPRA